MASDVEMEEELVKKRQLSEVGSTEAVVEAVAAQRPKRTRSSGAHGHDEVAEVVRTANHKGHEIVVRTTYSIEVDGSSITGHFGVTDDGQVHYHAVPNLSFASAIDMVKKLIDAFPDDFPDPADDKHDHDAGGGH